MKELISIITAKKGGKTPKALRQPSLFDIPPLKDRLTLERLDGQAAIVGCGAINILFSYNVPVAFHIKGCGYTVRKTYYRYSRTTTRHINKFLPTVTYAVINDDDFFKLVAKHISLL